MEYLNNSTNLDAFKKAVAKAKERILICSAWVRSETLKKVFAGVNPKDLPPVKILMRMGGSGDYLYTDIDHVLEFASEIGAEVRYLPNLHAKINVVDSFFATVGSFNLTGGGYGDADRAGTNDEVGICIEDAQKVEELAGIFEDLWSRAFTVADDVLGLTLSDGTNRSVGYIGTKEIEKGSFVEIEAEDYDGRKRRWLGAVVVPYAHHTAFVSELSGAEGYESEQFKQFIEALTTKETRARALKIVTLNSELPYPHLRSGRIEILKEITGDGGLRFNRIPIPGAVVVKRSPKELLRPLYCPEESMPFATLVSNADVEVGLKYNEILTKHLSVFGTTGSGKSFFTKRFLKGFYHWLVEREKGRIVVIDTHDEYSKNNEDFPEFLKEKAIYINARDIKSIVSKKILEEPDDGGEIDFKGIFGFSFSSEELNILKDAYRESNREKTEDEKIKLFLSVVEEATKEKDVDEKEKKIVEDLVAVTEGLLGADGLDMLMFNSEPLKSIVTLKLNSEGLDRKSKKRTAEIEKEVLDDLNSRGDTYDLLKERAKEEILSEICSAYRNKPKLDFDPKKFERVKKAFEEGRVGFEFRDVVEKIEPPGLYVLSVRDLDSDEDRQYTVGAFLRAVFNRAKVSGGDFKTLLVVEEAHNYAPEKKGAHSKEIIKRIASEGRKFNVGLMVVTQRPAYIAKDVIAQCNSSVIFRLINSGDIDAIKNTVEAASEDMLGDLPLFDTGQCIVTGVSVYQPAMVMVNG